MDGEAFINDQGQLNDLAHIGPSKLWKTLFIYVPVWYFLLPTILLTLGSRGIWVREVEGNVVGCSKKEIGNPKRLS